MKKRKKKPSRNYKSILIGLLSLGAIAYYAISHLPQATPIGINEVAVSPSTVTLFLPTTISATPGVDASADIMINTGGAKVTAVQVELTYDVAKLSTPTIVQGDFLTDKLGAPTIKDGLISFDYVVPLQSEGKGGEGKLATLKFKAKSSDSQLSFTGKTMVAAQGTNSNVLSSATGSNIVLSSTINDQPSTISTTPPALSTTNSNPTYLPENDYDYSQAAPTSAFARFLATIKALFEKRP